MRYYNSSIPYKIFFFFIKNSKNLFDSRKNYTHQNIHLRAPPRLQ